MAQLSLSAEEDYAFTLEGSLCSQTVSYELCMGGKLLSPHRIHVPSFKERVAAMWRPGRGIFVQELDDRRFLFKFFHEYDISKVLEGGPWIYDNTYILLHCLMLNEAPLLFRLTRWISRYKFITFL